MRIKQDYGASPDDTTHIASTALPGYIVEKDSGFVYRVDWMNPIVGSANPVRYRRTQGVCVERY